jgi:hypothetical protein
MMLLAKFCGSTIPGAGKSLSNLLREREGGPEWQDSEPGTLVGIRPRVKYEHEANLRESF